MSQGYRKSNNLACFKRFLLTSRVCVDILIIALPDCNKSFWLLVASKTNIFAVDGAVMCRDANMNKDISQSRVMVTCRPHKPEITGSTPVSAIVAAGL